MYHIDTFRIPVRSRAGTGDYDAVGAGKTAEERRLHVEFFTREKRSPCFLSEQYYGTQVFYVVTGKYLLHPSSPKPDIRKALTTEIFNDYVVIIAALGHVPFKFGNEIGHTLGVRVI